MVKTDTDTDSRSFLLLLKKLLKNTDILNSCYEKEYNQIEMAKIFTCDILQGSAGKILPALPYE